MAKKKAPTVVFTDAGFYAEDDADFTAESWLHVENTVLDAVVPYDDPSKRVLAAQAALIAAGYFVTDDNGMIEAAKLGILF